MFKTKRPGTQDPQLDATDPEERLLEQRLREAVAAGKFHLQYQPLVRVSDGDVVGFEALLRWDSETGRVYPARFLPMLESSGLVHDVGPWVLAQACGDARPWLESHPELTVAVNVSPQQVEAGFAQWVLGTLSTMGVAPERLCLELIRPAFIADPAEAWSELRRLKTEGVRLSVDDFGTLGSSIADLRRFAIDWVKIDSSFVAGLGHSAEDEAAVQAIIALAHALRLQTVAEGVETKIQLERLQDLGCDLAQGFLLMEPVSASGVATLLAELDTEAASL
jgi:EAL domain-containing protein (putative c-di-GMP-specific phosphodiesterase class I)